MNIFPKLPLLDLNNKTILITGATGSFGNAIIKSLLAYLPQLKSILIFSRDEFKQLQLMNSFSEEQQSKVQFILGDIRDKEAVDAVFKKSVDYVFHAAALKHISFSEVNPNEFIKTNIQASQHIFDACNQNEVEKCVVISSDKAAAASNTYGRTKAEMERLMHQANLQSKCKFAAIRFGNFWASRGSVVPQFIMQFAKKGEVKLFNETSSRFFITLQDAANFALIVLHHMMGGEIFIPKLPSIYIKHIAEAIAGNNINLIKNRKGEKTHEHLLSEPEIRQTLENKSYFILTNNEYDYQIFKTAHKAEAITSLHLLKSDMNTFFLTIEEVKQLVENYKEESLAFFHSLQSLKTHSNKA